MSTHEYTLSLIVKFYPYYHFSPITINYVTIPQECIYMCAILFELVSSSSCVSCRCKKSERAK